MPKSHEDRKKTLTRLRRIQGQCAALETALASGAECGAILQQLAAVRGGVNGLMSEILEIHLREELGVPEAKGVDLDAVLGLVRSYLK
ncbi:metal/formaldehyde-sensitive transcriptional repressor [Poseidonocella sp. HB161398]|uniref:metal/formaldehyde-sensitive transcriptional repressor n=1 Tax=Poseidonocella sp. HB161398 TaxID=2320855 RepID=UPI0011084225|nr:metal/formaldehyde-sensitive transcriptional repressor [Poseidonocella sp. HB161398]